MNNQLYIIKKLPLYIDEDIINKKIISRNRNEKGEITRISINDQINYIAHLDYKVGNAIRGNHYHLIKKEFLYLCKGKIKGFFKDINNDTLYEELIEEGTLVQINPRCIHAFEAIENGYAIEYSPNSFNETCTDSYFITIKVNS